MRDERERDPETKPLLPVSERRELPYLSMPIGAAAFWAMAEGLGNRQGWMQLRLLLGCRGRGGGHGWMQAAWMQLRLLLGCRGRGGASFKTILQRIRLCTCHHHCQRPSRRCQLLQLREGPAAARPSPTPVRPHLHRRPGSGHGTKQRGDLWPPNPEGPVIPFSTAVSVAWAGDHDPPPTHPLRMHPKSGFDWCFLGFRTYPLPPPLAPTHQVSPEVGWKSAIRSPGNHAQATTP